jgi:hypothetical protein
VPTQCLRRLTSSEVCTLTEQAALRPLSHALLLADLEQVASGMRLTS